LANIITDDFETGGFSATWNAGQTTDGGNLSVAAAAKLHGNYGMSCLINDTHNMYTEYSGSDIPEVRFRFYIDPNTISMPNGGLINLVANSNSGWSNNLYIQLEYYTASGYHIALYAITDTGDKYYETVITDAPHCVEAHFKSATGAGANNGILKLWVDGALIGSDTAVDNDTKKFANCTFGAFGMSATTAGTFYMDDFVANNDGTYIGPIISGVAIPVLMNQYRMRRE